MVRHILRVPTYTQLTPQQITGSFLLGVRVFYPASYRTQVQLNAKTTSIQSVGRIR